MTALLLALVAGYGVHLVWTSLALGWSGLRAGPSRPTRQVTRRSLDDELRRWLTQAGLAEVRPLDFAAVSVVTGIAGGILTYAVFGGAGPAVVAGSFAATAPTAVYRSRRRARRERAQEAWPFLIEEIRILTGSVGRSIPQALFEAGGRAPDELRGAFQAAHREWLITTDLERTIAVLKERLADPTADTACETLLVAHEVGGSDLDRRLEALAEDRLADLHGRRDARSKQAGVRFARWFVLIVPLGMALAGMTIGNGRAAYQEPTGQALVAVGLVLVVLCWWWGGRYLRLPEEERVFGS